MQSYELEQIEQSEFYKKKQGLILITSFKKKIRCLVILAFTLYLPLLLLWQISEKEGIQLFIIKIYVKNNKKISRKNSNK